MVLATTGTPKNTSSLHFTAAAKAVFISVTNNVSSTMLSIVVGNIGGTEAKLFVNAGHEVAISNSRGPESLTSFVNSVVQILKLRQ